MIYYKCLHIFNKTRRGILSGTLSKGLQHSVLSVGMWPWLSSGSALVIIGLHIMLFCALPGFSEVSVFAAEIKCMVDTIERQYSSLTLSTHWASCCALCTLHITNSNSVYKQNNILDFESYVGKSKADYGCIFQKTKRHISLTRRVHVAGSKSIILLDLTQTWFPSGIHCGYYIVSWIIGEL